MDITVIIQIAIGVMFVWITLAVITSQIQDWIASVLSWRAQMLESAVIQMLGDQELKEKVYNHPLIQGLYTNNGKRKPAGIPEDKFALVLFEKIMGGEGAAEVKYTFDSLKQNVAKLKASENHELRNFATSLDTLLIGVENKAEDTTHAITVARQRVESWFNNAMDRLGGAYRRRMQIVSIVVGILLAAVLNVDTAAIVSTLWRDPVVRQAIVTQASQLPEPTPGATPAPNANAAADQVLKNTQNILNNMDKLNAIELPIGWSFKVSKPVPNTPADPRDFPSTFSGWLSKIIGILMSGIAAAQGAPFWFDLMRKLVTRNPPVPPVPS